VLPDIPEEGSGLEKYVTYFSAVEINSSFHRSHRTATYEKWAAAVPDGFQFSVKIPKTITHVNRLVDCGELTARFMSEVRGLGDKLAALLVQFPPSYELDVDRAKGFFADLRAYYDGDIFVEPRHRTWFSPAATKMMYELRLGRVAADPPVVPAAAEPGGVPGHVYFRLHGSPQVYFSSYTTSYLDGLAFRVRMHLRAGDTVWCIFDNTIQGHAAANALTLLRKIELGQKAANG
jgi:uncharacterized protein YecE (DUF72 family)